MNLLANMPATDNSAQKLGFQKVTLLLLISVIKDMQNYRKLEKKDDPNMSLMRFDKTNNCFIPCNRKKSFR
jgi:hypothetical protein